MSQASNYRPKRFKIGLDYGTTFSAGTYSLCSESTIFLKCGDIRPFYNKQLANAHGFGIASSKRRRTEIPSDILYKGNDIRIGEYAFGHYPEKDEYIVRRAKLGLDDRPETANARAALMQTLEALPGNKSPVQVITDYLSKLFAMFKDQLNSVGYDPRDTIEMNCTVPSIWTHQARRSMVRAVKAAAQSAELVLDPIVRLWPEAEAATEHILTERPNLNIRKDDVFVVCDAGGGTVDITTYMAETTNPLRLKEVLEPCGVLCGSTFLDEGFSRYIEARVQACPTIWQTRSKPEIRKSLHNANVRFVKGIKPLFHETSGSVQTFDFPGFPAEESNGFSMDMVHVTGDDLGLIFEKVARELWEHLKTQLLQAEQKQHAVKFILFTGGLSQSPFMEAYLRKELRQESEKAGHPEPISLIEAETADHSVALGAILCSLKTTQENSTRRINSKSIGIPYRAKYVKKEKKHNVPEVIKVTDEVDNKEYVSNMMFWVLQRGDQQPLSKTIRLSRDVPADTVEDVSITITLYACDHACEDGYPMSWYEARSQECYPWEEVQFVIDMSVLRARLKPRVMPSLNATIRKARRRQQTEHRIGLPRRSARLKSSDSTTRPTVLGDRDEASWDTRSTDSHIPPAETPPQELIEDQEEEISDSQKYFRVQYYFTMQFVGLLAKYDFRCTDVDYSRHGIITLPDNFEFGE